jgi:hypothetical protein
MTHAYDPYDPAWWLVIDDAAEADDLTTGARRYLCVTRCRDPLDRHGGTAT